MVCGMNKQDVIGELLYIGLVAEKGRCSGQSWRLGYKKSLKRHIMLLRKFSEVLMNERDADEVLQELVILCKKNHDIGKFYNISSSIYDIRWEENETNFGLINRFIRDILSDISCELNKLSVNKKKVYLYIRIAHNLPRVYLGKDKKTLCNIHQAAISESDAIQFSYQNMSEHERERYGDYLKL